MRDFLKSGDCAFDVGANIGALSIAMSRMVGPEGQVHSFEGNPNLENRLINDLVANKAENVHVTMGAVFERSGEILNFYCEDSANSAGSGLFKRSGNTATPVPSISLDDYANSRGVKPILIKIDVEGAEAHVLIGAKNLIETIQPVIILEYTKSVTQIDPLDFLSGLGYRFFDVSTYREVSREFYSQERPENRVFNVVAIPPNSFGSSGYGHLEIRPLQTLKPDKPCRVITPIEIRHKGRYIVRAVLEGDKQDAAGLGVYDAKGERLYRVDASLRELKAEQCCSMVFETNGPMTGRVTLDMMKGDSGVLLSAEVSEVVIPGKTDMDRSVYVPVRKRIR